MSTALIAEPTEGGTGLNDHSRALTAVVVPVDKYSPEYSGTQVSAEFRTKIPHVNRQIAGSRLNFKKKIKKRLCVRVNIFFFFKEKKKGNVAR